MAVHGLENGHGEQLLKGGQQHEIGEIIQLIHALPFHQTQQPEVFRRVFQDGLDLIMSVGDQPEGKAACPQKSAHRASGGPVRYSQKNPLRRWSCPAQNTMNFPSGMPYFSLRAAFSSAGSG